MNEPNGTTPINPEAGNQEPIGNEEQAGAQVEEPRLYAGRFKTPEELEEHYKLSSNEGKRLYAEVQRLQGLVQAGNQVEKPAENNPAKKGYDGFFDEDTKGALDWMIKRYITDYATSQKSQSAYVNQVSNIWEETKKDYPDLNNPKSDLFQLADKLLFERGLAERNGQGDLVLATPYAYRIAVETAYAQLAKTAPQRQATTVKKNQAMSVSGRSTGFTPTGKLTQEQYDKLSDDDKDKYDQWQISQGQK